MIRDRRNLLGLSQEDLSDEACGLRSVSRIENEDRKVQRKNRMKLLKKVNMSGERYDYEIISERYEDYLLRSELDRAINNMDLEEANRLLSILRKRIPDIATNQQYILKKEAAIRIEIVEDHPNEITLQKQKQLLEKALQLTLPLDLNKIDSWPVSVLTVNEILCLMMYAIRLKNQEKYQESLPILSYIQICLENTGRDLSYYEDLYTRLGVMISGILRKLGRFHESESVSLECMKLSLENQNARRLAYSAYTVACNIEAQAKLMPEEVQEQRRQEAFQFYKQAYVAAAILNDRYGLKQIKEYCDKNYTESLPII